MIRKAIELGKEYVKLAVKEMPTIPLMAYNVFTAMDQTYWTGFPTVRKPLHQSGAELGQLPLHVRQAQAGELGRDGKSTAYAGQPIRGLSERPCEACPVRP